jgi:hypothetical protein
MGTEKSQVRDSKPLSESPTYNLDGSKLSDKLKQISADSAKRRADSYAERKKVSDARRERSKGRQAGSGGSLQGLNTSLGGKIVK